MQALLQRTVPLMVALLTVAATAHPAPAQEPPGREPIEGEQAPEEIRVEQIEVELPSLVLTGIPSEITLRAIGPGGEVAETFQGTLDRFQGFSFQEEEIRFTDGVALLKGVTFDRRGMAEVRVAFGDASGTAQVRVIPGWLSLVPPLLAIALALIFKQVLISLFAGIWIGAIFIYDYSIFTGLLRALDTYVIGAVADPDHAAIILFSMTLGGMVGILAKSGGTQGIVNIMREKALDYRKGQIASWAMSMLMFFDDYANVLLVGNTMRPFTDRLRISREKLAYLVDASAAPVVSLFFISTWIGFEVGLLDQALQVAGLEQNAYITFLKSTPYRFYSVFSIVFVFFIAWSGRDFGPMLAAEKRARETGETLRPGSVPLMDKELSEMVAADVEKPRWYNGLVPIIVVIVSVIAGLFYSGYQNLAAGDAATLTNLLGGANSYHVLMWAAFAGAVTAAAMVVTQRILSLQETLDAWIQGCKSMVVAMTILVSAWGIGAITVDMKTADYIIFGTQDILSPHLIPMLTFVIAAFTGFSTGSSWGTMAILYPLVVPLSVAAGMGLPEATAGAIFLGTIASVLSGSVFGDHCSPISDTTIMSSMSAGCDHIDHVKTQIPYAVTVMLVSAAVGYLPTGWGLQWYISIPIGLVVVVLPIYIFGRRSRVPGEQVEPGRGQEA
ncbi:MAG: Na+/H+ antiporter NhaC family protein [bacterium]